MFAQSARNSPGFLFRLFGVPIRVQLMFWVSMALIGMNEFQANITLGLIWVAVGFVSVLVHEFGHAAAFRYYRSPSMIELVAFGGLTIPSYPPTAPWRRIAVAVAGPAAGFALLAVVMGSQLAIGWARVEQPLTLRLFEDLVFVNLVWSLINLLPVYGFDGGHILREVFVLTRRRQPDRLMLRCSLVVCAVMAVGGLLNSLHILPPAVAEWMPIGLLGAIFFGLFAMQSYQALERLRPRLYADDRVHWRR